MTLYEIIKNNAEMGYHSIFQDEYGDLRIVSPFLHGNGNYRESCRENSIHGASMSIGTSVGVSREGWGTRESNGAKYIGIYQPEPYKLFQPGDKVLVREDAEKWLMHYRLNETSDGLREMFGKVCVIKSQLSTDYAIYNEDKTDFWYFPSQALEPYYETTPKVKEMTVAEISEALGYDVKVVK